MKKRNLIMWVVLALLLLVLLLFSGCKRLAYVEDVRVVQAQRIVNRFNVEHYIIVLNTNLVFLSDSVGEGRPRYAVGGLYELYRAPSGRFKLVPKGEGK